MPGNKLEMTMKSMITRAKAMNIRNGIHASTCVWCCTADSAAMAAISPHRQEQRMEVWKVTKSLGAATCAAARGDYKEPARGDLICVAARGDEEKGVALRREGISDILDISNDEMAGRNILAGQWLPRNPHGLMYHHQLFPLPLLA